MLSEMALTPFVFKTLTGTDTVSPWQIVADPIDTPELTERFRITTESQPFAAIQVTL